MERVKDDKKLEADSGAVARLLSRLNHSTPLAWPVAKKDKWSGFKVDSTGTNVSVYYGANKKPTSRLATLDSINHRVAVDKSGKV